MELEENCMRNKMLRCLKTRNYKDRNVAVVKKSQGRAADNRKLAQLNDPSFPLM